MGFIEILYMACLLIGLFILIDLLTPKRLKRRSKGDGDYDSGDTNDSGDSGGDGGDGGGGGGD